MPFFVAGSYCTIYHDPLTREHREGTALLVSCRRPYTKFRRPGLIAETWDVIFRDDKKPCVRVVTEPLNGEKTITIVRTEVPDAPTANTGTAVATVSKD